MIIGREKEIELLSNLENDECSHFVAVYGRLHIGKTFVNYSVIELPEHRGTKPRVRP